MGDLTEFGLRGLPSMSARTRPAGFPPFLQTIFDAAAASLTRPLVGISTDGNVRPGLFPLHATGVPAAPILDAARGFLAALDTAQRAKVVLDTEADEHRIHSIIRTPNGGDYGTDLLRQHHERFDHSGGRHVRRR
jgi:hypothetical protein